MDSVFNIHPNNLKIPKIINEKEYTFLNNTSDINIQPYYDILNTIEDFKIKNIYHFLYLRSILINRKYDTIPKLNKEFNSFNTDISNYINNDHLKAILIMNGIQQYFIPIKD
jgi:hypothetical protein